MPRGRKQGRGGKQGEEQRRARAIIAAAGNSGTADGTDNAVERAVEKVLRMTPEEVQMRLDSLRGPEEDIYDSDPPPPIKGALGRLEDIIEEMAERRRIIDRER